MDFVSDSHSRPDSAVMALRAMTAHQKRNPRKGLACGGVDQISHWSEL